MLYCIIRPVVCRILFHQSFCWCFLYFSLFPVYRQGDKLVFIRSHYHGHSKCSVIYPSACQTLETLPVEYFSWNSHQYHKDNLDSDKLSICSAIYQQEIASNLLNIIINSITAIQEFSQVASLSQNALNSLHTEQCSLQRCSFIFSNFCCFFFFSHRHPDWLYCVHLHLCCNICIFWLRYQTSALLSL